MSERAPLLVATFVLACLAMVVLLVGTLEPVPPPAREVDAPAATAAPELAVSAVDAANGVRRWASLVTEVRSAWMPDGPLASTDCGPAAMASALRLAGLDVPGAGGRHDERLLRRARLLATGSAGVAGNVAPGGYTYLPQLARLARLAGARTRVTGILGTALDWSRAGAPVVLQGAPLRAWDARLPGSVVRHVAGGHYVVLAGPVTGRDGWWWVLEPLGVRGPIQVSTDELRRFVADWNGAAMRVVAP